MHQAHPTPSREESLEDLLAHIAHLLPAQGPIGVFIHHNTLHAFQHLPFEQAVRAAADVFGAEPYMGEADYREAMRSGRIHLADLDRVLEQEGRDVPLRRAMLVPGVSGFRPETIRWQLDERGWRTDDLFRLWYDQATLGDDGTHAPRRPQEGLLRQTGEDLDDAVHPLLIRLAGAFLDQGLAYWPMPRREEGLWRSALLLLGQPGLMSEKFQRLPVWVERWRSLAAADAVEAAMQALGVEDRAGFLEAELLALPGWAGLIRQLENDPALAPHEAVPACLVDFVALRLLLTEAALDTVGHSLAAWKSAQFSPTDTEAARLVRAALARG